MMPNTKKISILLPVFNEEGNVGAAIASIRMALPSAEIIIVDDGSVDQTFSEAKQLENDSIKVFSITHKGKGHAVQHAIKMATGAIMVQIDADLQFSANDIPVLIQPIIDKEADIVFGSRFLEHSKVKKGAIPFVRRLASYLTAMHISFICRQRYSDIFAGIKAWRADAIKDINISENGFAYEAEIAIKAMRHGHKIIEVPVSYNKRFFGKSKINFFYHVLEIPWRIFYMLFFVK